MSAPILFLDIDGVLLPARAWAQPANAEARRLMRQRGRDAMREAQELVAFDSLAVGLVNRLAAVTGARIVIASNWRYSFGVEGTRDKLLAQGLDAALLHEHHSCPRTSVMRWEKARDIDEWLQVHRMTPLPRRPRFVPFDRRTAAYKARWERWQAARDAHGVTFVTLDDDPGLPSVVLVDPEDGVSCRDYRVACRALGGEDPEMGVRPIPEDDLGRILDAWEGDRFAMARWLHRAEPGQRLPASLLEEPDPAGILLGFDPRAQREKSRARFWADLAEATRRPEGASDGDSPEYAEF
jgi:hypothetical protein